MRPSSTGMAPVDSRPPAVGKITSAQSRVYGGFYQSRATRLMARVHEALLTTACGIFERCPPNLRMSVDGGRAEVGGTR